MNIDNIDVLLFNGVSAALDSLQEANLKSFIKNGGDIFFAQNRISVDIQTQQATPIESNIFDILTPSFCPWAISLIPLYNIP